LYSSQKIGKILQAQRAVVPDREGRSVKLAPSIDEGRNSDKVEIAAEAVIIEERPGLGDIKRFERICRCNIGGGSEVMLCSDQAGGGDD
jgi:hypothetical protein